MNESDSTRSPLAAAACLSLAGFFFPRLQPMFRMGGDPAVRQQGFQGSGVAGGDGCNSTQHVGQVRPHVNAVSPGALHQRVEVEKFGGICDGGGNTNLVFSVPVSFGFPAVEALFDNLVAQYPGSSWLFGNVYDPWSDFKPLKWWV